MVINIPDWIVTWYPLVSLIWLLAATYAFGCNTASLRWEMRSWLEEFAVFVAYGIIGAAVWPISIVVLLILFFAA